MLPQQGLSEGQSYGGVAFRKGARAAGRVRPTAPFVLSMLLWRPLLSTIQPVVLTESFWLPRRVGACVDIG